MKSSVERFGLLLNICRYVLFVYTPSFLCAVGSFVGDQLLHGT